MRGARAHIVHARGAMPDLQSRVTLAKLTTEDRGLLRCTACAHRCVLGTERRVGACGVRFVSEGKVYAPFGYVARRYVRAIESNTVYHVEPGAKALTFGMYGCDLRCPYCHNWKLSQALREGLEPAPIDITPAALVDEAMVEGCRAICAAYNEPMIAAEWVRAIFEVAKRRGLRTMIVSDGNTTGEALEYVRPYTDVFRVDLKGWTAEHYRTLGGRVEPVLEAIAEARRLGLWVEVVTLVVPGFNDDLGGLRLLAKKLLAIDPDIPWHLNAFQPRYRMLDRPAMAPGLLVSAAGAAFARGLRFVYVGNVSTTCAELEHTRCPACRETLVERFSYTTRANKLREGRCVHCRTPIPGLWSKN